MAERTKIGFDTRAAKTHTDGLRRSRPLNLPIEQTTNFQVASSTELGRARTQMRGGGGVLSFEVVGGLAGARAFLDALGLIPIATGLGGVETVVEIPSDLDFSEEELGEAAGATGIAPGLIRLSVGIEEAGDLREDLERGLAAVRSRDLETAKNLACS